jgi:NAD(P)-dependent dehydrogenase (short-subunit alcohol dehydrogenase family)
VQDDGRGDGPSVVLVTGGTRGIGAAVARRFLAAGAHVAVCSRSGASDAPAIEGRRASTHTVDVRDPDAVAALVDEVVATHGRLDVAVNNAGGSPSAAAAEASPRFHAAIIDLNLTAALHVAQAANRVMQQQPAGGVVVNVGSVSGLRPSPGTAAYGAAKAGLIGLTRSLAVEWAPKVRVACVTPGLVATEGADDHYADPAAIAATVPLGRFATPEEVADAIHWIASPAASYVSGSNLVLDGGGEWPAFLRASPDTGGD